MTVSKIHITAIRGLLVSALVLPTVLAQDLRSKATDAPLSVGTIEELYADTRALGDRIDIASFRGETGSANLAELIASYNSSRSRLQQALSVNPVEPVSGQDLLALAAMRRALVADLPETANEESSAGGNTGEGEVVDCRYDPEAIAKGEGGYQALSLRIYHCFSLAARSLSFEGEAVDRLTVFGRLPLTDEPSRREKLWRAMEPVWVSVNGDNGPQSPYRTLVRLNAARMKSEGEVLGESVRAIGIEPALMEKWMMAVLQKWHDITPDTAIEPWDFAYNTGRSNRALSEAIPGNALREINDRFYRDLGADPLALQLRYDLEPRPGKDPVAFTTFGRRPRLDNGVWTPGEPWVFASYQIGGLDNLMELLHETGHAIHIAAIRTRPAFSDWPDSDIFTEGVADIATLDMYEPPWQRRYLGTAVPLEDAIIAKYAAIVMDIAWALFEVRMHRAPDSDPNLVWGEITHKYFRINPHPDLAWWAVRGQLIDSPGYMMNYAAGAIVNADLRARAVELYGPYTEGNPLWYEKISNSLYRFGLEKTSREVIEAFLGRPVSPQALLDDMSRALTPD
ncbi:MAG: hypothetical protein V2I26_17565 [Halieaceae bacterium]|jgi:hypothetical protein|nr:hypothetical protein [Halieaceae bacterium]